MAEYRFYTCDYCNADNSEGQDGLRYEDQARDEGWVTFSRKVFRESVYPAIPGTNVGEFRLPARTHHEDRHVCGGCLKDPELREWLEGWDPAFAEDRETLVKAGWDLAAD